MRKIVLLLLCLSFLSGAFIGCSVPSAANTETRTFIDSAGREVQIPVQINSIVPSGPFAQIILHTLSPDKLLGLSTPFTRTQMRYFDERYADMPVFGSFFGGTFSLESAMRASPDIIIDMGMPLVGIAADLDALQEQTGIPVIFIEATLGALADAYDTLGEILDLEELSSEMSLYIRNVLDFAEEVRNKIPMEQRLRVLYTQGEFGEDVFGRGSVHSEVLEYVGVYNVANIEAPLARGIAEVSMEQIMLWNPDIVILGPNSFYDDIWHDRLWAQVAAVQSGRVYEVPIGPYDWLNRPPSVQRILGIQWLGSLIYPQYYDFDIIERVQEFYRLFFRYELSADEARSMMANSIFKDRTEPSAG